MFHVILKGEKMIFAINPGKHLTKSKILCVIKPINRTGEKRETCQSDQSDKRHV